MTDKPKLSDGEKLIADLKTHLDVIDETTRRHAADMAAIRETGARIHDRLLELRNAQLQKAKAAAQGKK